MRLVKYRGRYYAYVGRGKRIALRTASRVEAEKQLEEYRLKLSRKEKPIRDIVSAYITEKKKLPSYNARVSYWKHAEPHFGDLLPEHITREVCRKYTEKRRNQGASDQTIRHEIGLVRSGIRWHSKTTPAVFELPPSPPPKERYLTKAEYKSLLGAIKHHHLKLFTRIAIATAARKSAILDLTWDRVDLNKRIIRLSKGEKTNKGRAVVPINESLYKALLEAKEGATCEYVIEYGGGKVDSVTKGFRTAADSLGMKGVTPHTLRHSAAVWMAEGGVAMDEIAQFLGHSTPSITYKVYARYSPSYLQKAAKALEIDI